MRISERGLQIIKDAEGLRLEPYADVGGKPTIGYGHLIKEGESFDRITEAEAERLLKQDIEKAEKAVNALVKVPLSQGQFDALVSFVYNVGRGNFGRSTMLRKLNAGDYDGAAREFERWKYVGMTVMPGLVARRSKEADIFRYG